MTTTLSTSFSAISIVLVVLIPHVSGVTLHELRYVPRDLSNYRLEEVARASSIGDGHDGVLVIEPLNFMGFLGEASEVSP